MIELNGNHLRITKGDTGSFTLSFKQKCKPFNLNGWTVRFIVKQKGAPDSTAIIDTTQSISTDTDKLSLVISNTDTAVAGSWDWAVRIAKDQAVYTPANGIFTVEQGVFA